MISNRLSQTLNTKCRFFCYDSKFRIYTYNYSRWVSRDGKQLQGLEMSSVELQKRVLTATREFIVENLDADDVVDELIQANMILRTKFRTTGANDDHN